MMARHALRLYRRLILRLYDGCIPQIDWLAVFACYPLPNLLSTRPAGDDENPHGKACGPPC